MAFILQGTTPVLELDLVDVDPDTGEEIGPADLSDVSEVEFTVAQNGVPGLIAHSYDVTIDVENSRISYAMTEAETLALRSGLDTLAQARFQYSNGAIGGIASVSYETVKLLSGVMFGEE